MTRRGKHKIVLIIALVLFFAMGSGVWSFQGGELMLLIYLAICMLAYMVYAFRTRCVRCRMPLLLRPVRLLGMGIYVWSFLTPERCRHCGADVEQGA